MKRVLIVVLLMLCSSVLYAQYPRRVGADTLLAKYGLRLISHTPGATPPVGFLYMKGDTLKIVTSAGITTVGTGAGGGGTMTGAQIAESLATQAVTTTPEWKFIGGFEVGATGQPNAGVQFWTQGSANYAMLKSQSQTSNRTVFIPVLTSDSLLLAFEGYIGKRMIDSTGLTNGALMYFNGTKWMPTNAINSPKSFATGTSEPTVTLQQTSTGMLLLGIAGFPAADTVFVVYPSGLTWMQQVEVGDTVYFANRVGYITSIVVNGTTESLVYGSTQENTVHNFLGEITVNGEAIDATDPRVDTILVRLDTLDMSNLNDYGVEGSIANNQYMRYNSEKARWENRSETFMEKTVDATGLDAVPNIGIPTFIPQTNKWISSNMPTMALPDTLPLKPLVGAGDTVGYVDLPDTGSAKWILTWQNGAMNKIRDSVVYVWNITAEDDTVPSGVLYKFEMPVGMYVTGAYAAVTTTDAADSIKIDVNYRVGVTDTTSIFSTAQKIVVRETYSTSRSYALQPTPITTFLPEGTFLTVECDNGGGAKGLKVTLKGWKP